MTASLFNDNRPEPKYVEVILPVPVPRTFTYRVPDEYLLRGLEAGQRVIVPFGLRKYLTGIVRSISTVKPQGFEVKEIAAVPDPSPIVRFPQVNFWEWMAEYYMCSVGDVMRAALPAGLKIESESFVELNPDYEADPDETLTDLEAAIVEQLFKGPATVATLQKQITNKRLTSKVSEMVENGRLIISEKLVERYRPKVEYYVHAAFDAAGMEDAFKAVGRSLQQQQLLTAFIQMSGANRRGQRPEPVNRQVLLKRTGATTQALRALVAKGLVEVERREVNRFKYDGSPTTDLPPLTAHQREALQQISEQWQPDRNTVLLHGVTSSGKTEIYSHLIAQTLESGAQALMLVPEIALTTQLTRRLQRIFGHRVVVYHSRFTDNERVDIWRRLLNSPEPVLVLGARSAVFLPFKRLGLVIVDEEHDPSYKQTDPAPRYNGRDAALVLARRHGAKALLGSATPSVETYWKALNGKFGIARLTKRFSDVPLPPIRLVDLTTERKRGAVRGPLAHDTIAAINRSLEQGKQAILFRNRRGFSPMVRCKQCAYVPRCAHCDVSLTYHQHNHTLTCHYCGASYPMPDLCPECRQPSLEVVGYGTERVEDELEGIFPDSKIMRMDLDTTRNKDSYERLIADFSAHKADILVGTQMVTKGLDFSDVDRVVVVNADELVNQPDFKASERAYNLLEQVAGRAGRRSESASEAEVIVQTYTPDAKLFEYLRDHDYEAFYRHEIAERRQFCYPPFVRVIYIVLRNADRNNLTSVSYPLARDLTAMLGTRVSGPDTPRVGRVKGHYIQQLMVKIENGINLGQVRSIIFKCVEGLASLPAFRSTTIHYDVDP